MKTTTERRPTTVAATRSPGRTGSVDRVWSQQMLSRVPRWSSQLVLVLGLLAIASAILPRRRHLLEWPIELLPPLGRASVSVIGIGVGFGLVIMARGLRHRKQHAWWTVIVLLGIGIVVHLIHGTALLQTAISAAVVAVLIISRRQFVGRGDLRSRRTVPVVFVAMVLSCWVVGALLTQADRDDLAPGWTLSQLLVHSLSGLVGVRGSLLFTTQTGADRNSVQLLGLGVLTVVVTVWTLLRSTRGRLGATQAERNRIRRLLDETGGTDSLGYFALRDDKSYVFSPSGKAAIGYRVLSGVCLAAADPVGDVEAWPGAIDAWLDQARRQAWVPAAIAVSETGAEAYRRAGLDCLEIGDEAVVDVGDFTLEGRPMRTVRQAVTRARKAGHTTTIHTVGKMTPEHLQAMAVTTHAWRSVGVERGFSMALSRFGAGEDPDSVIVEARSADGDLVALLQLVPWGRDGWSLDVMRRHPGLGSGVMELMITDLIAHAHRHGIVQVSLNFAFFRSSLARSERVGAGPVLRAWVAVLLFASRWWQIASLYRANTKFRPRWEPRFLSFASVSDLGQITIAALRAEGLLTEPRLLSRTTGSAGKRRATGRSPEPLAANAGLGGSSGSAAQSGHRVSDLGLIS